MDKYTNYTNDKNNYFEINKFFNDLPIRIIGSHDFPVFYAQEIAKILDLDLCNLTRYLKSHLDASCYVSKETMIKRGIIPKMNDGRTNYNMTMLTIYGVYVLMMSTTKTEKAYQFRQFVNESLESLRKKGSVTIEGPLHEMKIIQQSMEEIKTLTKELELFKTNSELIEVFRLPMCKYEIKQTRCYHSDDELNSDDSDYEDIDTEYNVIDAYDEYTKAFPELSQDRRFIYKITKGPSNPKDYSKYTHICQIYCNDSTAVLSKINTSLFSYKVGKHSNYMYQCDIDIITNELSKYVINIYKTPSYGETKELPPPEPLKDTREEMKKTMEWPTLQAEYEEISLYSDGHQDQ